MNRRKDPLQQRPDHCQVNKPSSQNGELDLGAVSAHYIEGIPANSQRAGKVVYQVVNHGLLFEQVRILIVNVSFGDQATSYQSLTTQLHDADHSSCHNAWSEIFWVPVYTIRSSLLNFVASWALEPGNLSILGG